MFFTDLRHFTASSNRVGLGIVGSREDHKVGPRTHGSLLSLVSLMLAMACQVRKTTRTSALARSDST